MRRLITSKPWDKKCAQSHLYCLLHYAAPRVRLPTPPRLRTWPLPWAAPCAPPAPSAPVTLHPRTTCAAPSHQVCSVEAQCLASVRMVACLICGSSRCPLRLHGSPCCCLATFRPGYKATGVLDATNKIGATDYVACSAGQVSFWAGGVRTPTDATACQPCTNYGGTIAPRTGGWLSSGHLSNSPQSGLPCCATALLPSALLLAHSCVPFMCPSLPQAWRPAPPARAVSIRTPRAPPATSAQSAPTAPCSATREWQQLYCSTYHARCA